MTNHWNDIANSDCILIMGSNAAENHPISFKYVTKAIEQGATLISVDPRFTRTSSKAHMYAALRSGTDIAFLGGMIKYILDNNLEFQGAVQDLGLGERIYSVRFLQDKGYVVTYREIDPFYVLDLSDPTNPEVKGELKIPGYSSYLHPLAGDRILGIGKENWKVKLSLFDVSSPSDPKEAAKYILDESWSDVLSTHHAFLLDSKHNIFFLPGSKGGYIFSYENDELKLVKAVSQRGVRRAIYINDYLYIISDEEISVLNEKDWERVNELDI